MSRSAQAKSNAKGAWRHADSTVAMRPRTPRTPRGGRATFALESFSVGELVLCKNVNRPQSLWPVRRLLCGFGEWSHSLLSATS